MLPDRPFTVHPRCHQRACKQTPGFHAIVTTNTIAADICTQAYVIKTHRRLIRGNRWRAINAQGLVTGRVARQSDGRLKVEFRLWDVFAGQQLLGQQYFTQPENWRRVSHIISDAIYERLTGEKGYFDTRIVF
ncbi:MAG: hypothetical protein B7X78_10525, partial [Sphingomonadales bacterium 39-62-4]